MTRIMRAVTVLCLLALAASASAFAQEDPCVAEVLKCRNEICKNREVLENSCESGEGSFMKACSCGGLLEQQQPEGENSLERAVEASMGAQDQPANQEEQEMDCDEMKMEEDGEQAEVMRREQEAEEEAEQRMIFPQLGGFTFRFNLGRRFGPDDAQQQQQPRARFAGPSASSSSLGYGPFFGSIFGAGPGEGSDYADSFVDTGFTGGSLLDALFGPSSVSFAGPRQQFLLGAPSFVTRRVYYPAEQSQSRARQPALTMRLATPQELKALGVLDESANYANSETALLGEDIRGVADAVAAARQREAARNFLERWKAAAGVEQEPRPMSAVRISAEKVPRAAVVPVAPQRDVDDVNADSADTTAWYNGYRARRALYCVASIALVMAVIALNAALLMCCASACCRSFSPDDAEDLSVDSVAATTPLLVEYEVERVPKPGYEHVTEEEMIVVHHASMAPMPREGKAAY